MFTNNGYYHTSTDYKKLLEILKTGQTVACLLFDGAKKDYKILCEANYFGEFQISFGTPGIIYTEVRKCHDDGFVSELKIFSEKCREHGVEFLLSFNDGVKNCSEIVVSNFVKDLSKKSPYKINS